MCFSQRLFQNNCTCIVNNNYRKWKLCQPCVSKLYILNCCFFPNKYRKIYIRNLVVCGFNWECVPLPSRHSIIDEKKGCRKSWNKDSKQTFQNGAVINPRSPKALSWMPLKACSETSWKTNTMFWQKCFFLLYVEKTYIGLNKKS